MKFNSSTYFIFLTTEELELVLVGELLDATGVDEEELEIVFLLLRLPRKLHKI